MLPKVELGSLRVVVSRLLNELGQKSKLSLYGREIEIL